MPKVPPKNRHQEYFAASGYRMGQMNALVKAIRRQAGRDAVECLLRGEPITTFQSRLRLWHEDDGVIWFQVTSDGKTGRQWVKHLENKGVCVHSHMVEIMSSRRFKPTSGVTYHIGVIKAATLIEEAGNITSSKINEYGLTKHGLVAATVEIACLIADKLSVDDFKVIGSIAIQPQSVTFERGIPLTIFVGLDEEKKQSGLIPLGGGEDAHLWEDFNLGMVLSQVSSPEAS